MLQHETLEFHKLRIIVAVTLTGNNGPNNIENGWIEKQLSLEWLPRILGHLTTQLSNFFHDNVFDRTFPKSKIPKGPQGKASVFHPSVAIAKDDT